jgi:hypothetical protein
VLKADRDDTALCFLLLRRALSPQQSALGFDVIKSAIHDSRFPRPPKIFVAILPY